MGTLGEYLRKAREDRGIDLREAAQQTRISLNYLKALEEEDFIKLPGDVFVKGFLKSYGRYLKLDETETLRRFSDIKPNIKHTVVAEGEKNTPTAADDEQPAPRKTSVEPFLWGAAICISLVVFLFYSHPRQKRAQAPEPPAQAPMLATDPTDTLQASTEKPEKLYLEAVAMEDTWLLVRTDTSPQKKAVLRKGESLIWSADERFLVSYGRVDALKLLLNGQELIVQGPQNATVRDLAITRTGILNQPAPDKAPVLQQPQPKPRPSGQQSGPPATAPPAESSNPTPQAPVSPSKPAVNSQTAPVIPEE